MERPATQQYQRWLIADPVDRLVLDPQVSKSGVEGNLVALSFVAAEYKR